MKKFNHHNINLVILIKIIITTYLNKLTTIIYKSIYIIINKEK